MQDAAVKIADISKRLHDHPRCLQALTKILDLSSVHIHQTTRYRSLGIQEEDEPRQTCGRRLAELNLRVRDSSAVRSKRAVTKPNDRYINVTGTDLTTAVLSRLTLPGCEEPHLYGTGTNRQHGFTRCLNK